MMNRTQRAALLASVLAIAGAGTAGCKRFKNLYSRDQEIQLGRQFSQEFEKDPKHGRFVTRGPQYERLQRVAARILPLARRDWDVPYSITLVDEPEVNAFAVPGGPIYFYKGLMDLAETDDEVASVLGHEASHIVRRHSAQQMSDSAIKAGLAELLLGRSGRTTQEVVGIGLALKGREFSRGDESQADEWGFKYLVGAGYRPEAMGSFFRKMQQKNGDSPGSLAILSTHPLTRKRIEAADKRAAAVRAGTYIAP